MKAKILISVMLYATVVVAAAQDVSQKSVFGFTIGKPVSLPECSRQVIGKSVFYYGFTNFTCFGSSNPKIEPSSISSDIYSIYFPVQDKPNLVSGTSIVMVILDGVLEGISFNTAGISTQDVTLTALKGKFGVPTEIKPLKVQNKLGASFDTFFASWALPGLIVQFSPTTGVLDSGLVEVQTPKAKEYVETRRRAALKDPRPM
jgi:hypothetical protein